MTDEPKFEYDGTTLTYRTNVSQEFLNDLKSIGGRDVETELRDLLYREFKEDLQKWVDAEWKKRNV